MIAKELFTDESYDNYAMLKSYFRDVNRVGEQLKEDAENFDVLVEAIHDILCQKIFYKPYRVGGGGIQKVSGMSGKNKGFTKRSDLKGLYSPDIGDTPRKGRLRNHPY